MIILISHTLSWLSQAETEREVTLKLNGIRRERHTTSIKFASLLNELDLKTRRLVTVFSSLTQV